MRACVFKVLAELFALPVDEVTELCSAEGITPVPRAPEQVLGVIHRRGRIIPVVELSASESGDEETPDGVDEALELLVLESEAGPLALRVDAVLGIHEVSLGDAEGGGPQRVASDALDREPALLDTRELVEHLAGLVAQSFDPRAPMTAANEGGGEL